MGRLLMNGNSGNNGGNESSSQVRSTVTPRLLVPTVLILLLGWSHWTNVPTKCPPSPVVMNVQDVMSPPTWKTTTTPTRKQRKIFIDLGVNCGNSYHLFKEGGVVGSRTTLTFGGAESWEAYLWEANPQMIDLYLKDLVAAEQAKGLNVYLIDKAAGTKDNQTISFFLTAGQELGTPKEKLPNPNCDPHSPYNPSGASSIYGTALRAGQEIKVETIDFLRWFKNLQLQAHDIVHIKMDIEGAELDIIEQFLQDDDTNQICFWSQFWTEYHKTIFPIGSIEYERHAQFEKTFPLRFEEKCGRPLWPNGVLS
jgi:FkbM family methyltransferase